MKFRVGHIAVKLLASVVVQHPDIGRSGIRRLVVMIADACHGLGTHGIHGESFVQHGHDGLGLRLVARAYGIPLHLFQRKRVGRLPYGFGLSYETQLLFQTYQFFLQRVLCLLCLAQGLLVGSDLMGVQVFRSPQLGPDDVVLYFVGIRLVWRSSIQEDLSLAS